MKLVCVLLILLQVTPALSAPIHDAVRAGDLARIEDLLQKGAPVDARDSHGITPLMVAASDGRTDVAARLIEKGASVDASIPPYGLTALHLACTYDRAEMVSLLLEKGAKIDAVATPDRHTLLTWALQHGARKAALLLIEKGAAVNPQGAEGPIPLALALEADLGDVARLLVQKGAQPSQVRGIPPLVMYIRLEDREQVAALLDKGANVNAKDANGDPLLWSAPSEAMFELLLSRGADVNARGEDGRTLLDGEVDPERAAFLLRKGMDPKIRDSSGRTPLHQIAWTSPEIGREENERAVQVAVMLIKHGADPNQRDGRDGKGYTPLQTAISQFNRPMVEALLANGADPNAPGTLGSTAVHAASVIPASVEERPGSEAILRLLIDQGGDVNARDNFGRTPLFYAFGPSLDPGHKAILLEKGADIRVRATDGRTLMHVAVRNNNREDVELLLSRGLDINARAKDGRTPLYEAVWLATSEYFQWLIGKGADPLARTATGQTLLFEAAKHNRQDIAAELIRRGADVNARDEAGVTALHVAAEKIPGLLVPLLIKHGANVNAAAKDGRHPLDVAYSEETQNSLLKAGGKAGTNVKTPDDEEMPDIYDESLDLEAIIRPR